MLFSICMNKSQYKVLYSKRRTVVLLKQTKEIGQPTRVIRLIYGGDNHQFRLIKVSHISNCKTKRQKPSRFEVAQFISFLRAT